MEGISAVFGLLCLCCWGRLPLRTATRLAPSARPGQSFCASTSLARTAKGCDAHAALYASVSIR